MISRKLFFIALGSGNQNKFLHLHKQMNLKLMENCSIGFLENQNDRRKFTIGIVGIVPMMKRIDKALDLLEKLREQDDRYVLRIKGKLPKDFPWMRNRQDELSYYEKPLISVVCCSVRPQYIERMAKNFTCQNYSKIELIFVLQGFKQKQIQNLKNIINDANSNIVSLKIFSENNINTLGERFNYGVSKSSGEYIAKMDDDDLYFSNYLSDMMIPFNFNDYGLVGKKEIMILLIPFILVFFAGNKLKP